MRLIVALLLMTLAAPAWAEWVKMGETDEAVFYLDPATIKRTAHRRRVWALEDYKHRSKSGGLSRRSLQEYDCARERFRNLSLSEHTERMASGAVLAAGTPVIEWDYITPRTVGAAKMKVVCG